LLTPHQRSLRARIGAHSLHSKYDPLEITQAARTATRASLDRRLLAEIDPDGELSATERARRLEHGRKAYFGKVALASVKVRQAKAHALDVEALRLAQGLPAKVADPSTLRRLARLLAAGEVLDAGQ